MSLYVVNGRQVIVPHGSAKVRGEIHATDRIWLPDVADWGEVRIFNPGLVGYRNDAELVRGREMLPVIRRNEDF